MPFEITNPRNVWTWQTPPDGELVPDHPPIDLTPYLADVQVERHDEDGALGREGGQ